MAFMDIPKDDFAAMKLIHGETVKVETVTNTQAADAAGEDTETWATSLTTTAVCRPTKFAEKGQARGGAATRREGGIQQFSGMAFWFTANTTINEKDTRIYYSTNAKYYYVVNVASEGNCERVEARDAEPGD